MTLNQLSDRLAQWKAEITYALENNVLQEVGEKTIEEFRNNFDSGSFFGDRWAAKSDGSVSRLVNTGALADSMSAATDGGSKTVTIKSDLPYSRIHNEGGTITQVVTAKQQRFMGAKWKRSKKVGSTLKTEMPKRQYMGNHAKLHAVLKNYIENAIKPFFK